MDLHLISTTPLDDGDKLEVVTVAEVRAQVRLRATDSAQDELIEQDIVAAYDFFSGPTGWLNRCSLLAETWEYYAPAPPYSSFELPMRPFSGETLVGFDYVRPDGSYVAIGSNSYYVVPNLEGFAIVGRAAASPIWPYVIPRHPRAYRIRFKAGYGAEREAVPAPIRKAIKLLAGEWFLRREGTGDGNVKRLPYGIEALAGRYRLSPDHS